MANESSPPPIPSESSPRNRHSPTSRRDDPSHPLAPRGLQTSGTWQYLPLVQFYTLDDERAKLEFENIVSPRLLSLLRDWEYPSYTVTLAHAGYSADRTVPVVLVIAPLFKHEHAKTIVDEFDRLDREYLCEVFCYEGDTKGYGVADELQTHQLRPNCGSSIGPGKAVCGADPTASSSLGFYLRFDGDDAIYATSVHHALGKNVDPVNFGSLADIPIQHPSSRDVARQIDEFEAEIQDAEAGKSELLIPAKKLQKDLEKLKKLDTTFGTVAASAYGVIQSDDDKFISEDWLLIKVAPDKAGINHLRGSVALTGKPPRPGLAWTPRDSYGVFVNGVDQPREGMWVRKAGRSTGDTVARIEFAYSHAKLLDNPVETREWTIVSSVFSEKDVFAVEGDSGAPVVNRVGNLVGVVLGGVCGKPLELHGHDELGKVYVTYITPAPFLIHRIGQVFGRTVSVERVDLDGIPGIIKPDESYEGDDSDS